MFDLIVIGGGPGGYAAAEFAARHGVKVALVERERLGGTCLNWGCVPTKAYLHATEAVRAALPYAPDALARFDRRAMYEEKNRVVETLTGGIAQLMKAGKVAVYTGTGTLLRDYAPYAVRVTGADGTSEEIEAPHLLLATGSTPARLPVEGCDLPGIWTSDDLLGEPGTEAFDSLLIVGGGVIGVEMACIYARLGVTVTILEAEKRCLPMMDIELGRSVEMLLKGMGVTLLTDARLGRLVQVGNGFTAEYSKGDAPGAVTADRVLLATGRRPVTEGLLGEGVSLRMNRRFIAVDEHFRTSLPGVYAIGDVNGVCQLAHAAHAQGLTAVSDLLGIPAPVNAALVPACVYTTPEIASVGYTQEEAKAQGIETVIGKAPTTQNCRSLMEGLGRGFIKLVFEKDTYQLIGAQLFCGRATDLVGELTLAIANQLTAEQLLAALRPHPTFEESITDAVMAARF